MQESLTEVRTKNKLLYKQIKSLRDKTKGLELENLILLEKIQDYTNWSEKLVSEENFLEQLISKSALSTNFNSISLNSPRDSLASWILSRNTRRSTIKKQNNRAYSLYSKLFQ